MNIGHLYRIDPREEGGGRTRAKSGEVEGGEQTLGGPRRAMADGGWRTERSFYFVLVPPLTRRVPV